MNQTKTLEKIIIRSWPKLIFLWPTMIFAIVAGVMTIYMPAWENIVGGGFLICLALNMIVLCFDFPRSTSLMVFVTIAAIVLGLILLNQRFEIIAPLKNWFAALELHASRDFYFCIGTIMALLFVATAFITRFDYWELTSNELIHRTGLMGDTERFSTSGLKLNNEIRDVFEYLLAGAGRVILDIPGSPRPIVLDNVLRIRRLMDQSQELLSRKIVQVNTSGGSGSQIEQQREAIREDE
jgi:hypothetical protein